MRLTGEHVKDGRLLFALLIVALVPALLFPGDAPFINDEPQLLLNALSANDAGTLALRGLMGTKGISYGPLPTWIYQALLMVTRDPVVLVALHALLMASAIALTLYWVARTTGLWPWFAFALVASPHLWLYERLLWDNTFNLAFTALALASYAAFLARGSRLALATTATLLVAAVLVHAMSLAFVVPMAVHMVVFARRALWRSAWLVLPAPLLLIALSWRYCLEVVQARSGPLWPPSLDGFLFAFRGAQLLGATGLGAFYGESWARGAPFTAAVLVSAVAFPLAWLGMFVAGARVASAIRRRAADVTDHVAGISLAIVACQAVLDGISWSFGYPHYHNATWIAHALLAWIAVDAIARTRRPIGRMAMGAAVALLAVALTSVNARVIAAIHETGGTRSVQYGTTIANQVEVVREIGRYPEPTPVLTNVREFLDYPQGLAALRALVARSEGSPARANALFVTYRSPDPTDAHVEVIAR